MGAFCYRMAGCSLFALVPTRCAADVEVGTSKASDGVSLVSVYATQAVKCGIYSTGRDGFTGGLVHRVRCLSWAASDLVQSKDQSYYVEENVKKEDSSSPMLIIIMISIYLLFLPTNTSLFSYHNITRSSKKKTRREVIIYK